MNPRRLSLLAACVVLAGPVLGALGLARTGLGLGQERASAQAFANSPDSLIAPGADFVKLATGYQFTEGPAPDRAGGLYFTDVFDSKIYHWSPGDGAVLYRADTNRTNGLIFDAAWQLIGCEWYGQRLVRDDTAGNVTVLADHYDGLRLNGPNDVWIAPNGRIYFSDPQYDNPAGFEQDASYVYFVPPEGGEPVRASEAMTLPNGLVGTADGQTLYVTDSAADTYRYTIAADGTLTNREPFLQGGGDGMELDEAGHVYIAAGRDIWIFDPDGSLVEQIRPPEPPSNLAFGGTQGRTMFITAQTSLYALEMTVRGAYAPPALATPTPGPATATPPTTPTATTPPATEVPRTATPTPGSTLYLPSAAAP